MWKKWILITAGLTVMSIRSVGKNAGDLAAETSETENVTEDVTEDVVIVVTGGETGRQNTAMQVKKDASSATMQTGMADMSIVTETRKAGVIGVTGMAVRVAVVEKMSVVTDMMV